VKFFYQITLISFFYSLSYSSFSEYEKSHQVTLENQTYKASIFSEKKDELRVYTLKSNAPLRDNKLSEKIIKFPEYQNHTYTRTGNLLFDGLYALAIHEAKLNSVSQIKDGAYNDGNPISLNAFQTGELWTYVWTRDLAYSVHLALAQFDTKRSIESLLFKTSPFKNYLNRKDEVQIIQDTGSGGSYPVSTDRVVWALGAQEALKYLPKIQQKRFLELIYPILKSTIEQDRVLVFDNYSLSGLYSGEQSFLDWREQSYPNWTKDNVVPISMSKTLSVNVAQYSILNFAAMCAEKLNKLEDAEKYKGWALRLKESINRYLYDENLGQYYAYRLSNGIYDLPVFRYDLLGSSLAVLLNVADEEMSKKILSNYPIGKYGPSVTWPIEKNIPIYHNQGIWPFVTAYWTKASKKINNYEAVNIGIKSLYDFAAINLSNMENFDFISGLPYKENGVLSGPVVNSRRQLWSVAGYLSIIQDVIFGLETSWNKIKFNPYITNQIRNEFFKNTSEISLFNFKYKDTKNDIIIYLPEISNNKAGKFEIKKIELNGKSVSPEFVKAEQLSLYNTWKIFLEQPTSEKIKNNISTADKSSWFAPELDSINEDKNLNIFMSSTDKLINGDNTLTQTNISLEHLNKLIDSDSELNPFCWSIVNKDKNNNISYPSPMKWNTDVLNYYEITANMMINKGGQLVDNSHFQNWGTVNDEILIEEFHVKESGWYLINSVFSNGNGPVNTGISCAVKKIEITSEDKNIIDQHCYLFMPQSGRWDRWDTSSFGKVFLKKGVAYKIKIKEDKFSINMSYLEQNFKYTSWPGGGEQVCNYVNISKIILRKVIDEFRFHD
tara:strand:+ start:1040 stop:3544 length:2505 start_codon:yes stop_codon:yes gene_type:complete